MVPDKRTEGSSEAGRQDDDEDRTEEQRQSMLNVVDFCVDDDESDRHVVPDGGWGWIVIVCTFFVNVLVSGTTFTLGVTIPPLWDHFKVEKATATAVGSVMILSIMSTGPIVGYLVNRFGCRPVMVIGGIINFVGAVSSTLSPNITVMIILFGFVCGVGLGFLYISSIVVVGYYFKKKIALASGIAMCGTSVGTFAFNPLREYLQDTYGWNTATMIFGGFGLLCVILAFPSKRVEPERDLFTKLWYRLKRKKTEVEKRNDLEMAEKLPEKRQDKKSLKTVLSDCWTKRVKQSTLMNPLLFSFLMSSALTMMGFAVPLVFMGEHGKNVGTSATKAVFLLSIIAISDGIGRIVLGIFCQKTGISPLKIKTFWIAVASASSFLLPFFKRYEAMATFSALIGLGYGSYIAMILPIFVAMVENKKQIATAVGAENLFSGISVAISAPVAGALFGYSGNLSTAFYYSGTSLALAVLVNIGILFHLQRIDTVPATTNDKDVQLEKQINS